MLLNSRINRMDSGQFENYDARFAPQNTTNHKQQIEMKDFQKQQINEIQEDIQEEYQEQKQVDNRPKQQTQYFNDEVEEIQYEQADSVQNSQKDNHQDFEPLELNPQLRDGPIIKRQCTNLSWFIFFILSTCIMATIATISFVYGHPDRLTQPYDPNGRACGIDSEVSDAPYIYMAVPYDGYFHRSVCVRECPFWDKNSNAVTQLDCVTNSQVSTCYQTLPYDGCQFPDDCASSQYLETSVFIYSTQVYFGRICLSSDTNIIDNTQLSEVFDITRLQQYFSDLLVARWALAGSGFIAYAFGFSFCVLMLFLPHILTWLGVIVYFINVALLGVFFMMKGQDFKDLQKDTIDPTAENSYYLDSIFLRTLSYVFFAIFILSFLGLICIFKHLKLAIKIIKTAQQFVKDTLEILYIPAFLGIFLIGQWAFWITVFLYAFSCGKLVNLSENELGPFGTVDWYDGMVNLLWYWFFGGLLTHAVLLTLNQFIITSSTCIWYFSQPYHQCRRPVLQSFYRAFRYHFGTIVFCASVLPFLQIFRMILEYIDKQARPIKEDQEPSEIAKCISRCLLCFMGCYENCIKYMNKSGYIYVSMTGDDFMKSSKLAYQIYERNAQKYETIIGTGQIFVFLGKLLISVTTTLICFLILSYVDYYEKNLYSPLFPSIFCLIFSYQIGNLFMSVFAFSIDAILQCAQFDEEIYQPVDLAAQHTPSALLEFMNEMGIFDTHFKSRNSVQSKFFYSEAISQE